MPITLSARRRDHEDHDEDDHHDHHHNTPLIDHGTTVRETGRAANGQPAGPGAEYDFSAMADYLTDGYWEATGQSRHSFADGNISVDLTALTAEGAQLARWALDAWEAVADISFTEVSSGADISFDDNRAGAFSGFTESGGTTREANVNIGVAGVLDVAGTTMDSQSFRLYLHEIGHALGLGHQGDYDATASYADAHFAHDTLQMTVMSYFPQTDNPGISADFSNPVTPMMVDILAIQDLYGRPTGGATAGNTLFGDGMSGNGTMAVMFRTLFNAPDSTIMGDDPVAFTLYDEGGTDTLDLRPDTDAQIVDLTPGATSDVLGAVGNMLIAQGTVIEHFRAGGASDRVIGNAADNALTGYGGNDSLAGGGGADTLEGGQGNDTISGGDDDDEISGGIGFDVLRGDAGHDVLTGLDGFDTISGGGGNDVLEGNNGFDDLRGGVGNDTLHGGLGTDTLSGDGGNDVLAGSAGTDLLMGGDGNDRLDGNAGADTLAGGAGTDNLAGGINHDLLDGGEGRDTLAGGNGTDTLRGDAGDDVLKGNAGADRLDGGAGNDILNGGIGADVFVFNGGNDRIIDFQTGFETVLIDGAVMGGLTLQGVLDAARVVEGNLLLDFTGGHSLQMNGITDAGLLEGSLDLI